MSIRFVALDTELVKRLQMVALTPTARSPSATSVREA